jgi:hypothetical protein
MRPETEMIVMRHEANVQEETYKLSVVIPCYNEMASGSAASHAS